MNARAEDMNGIGLELDDISTARSARSIRGSSADTRRRLIECAASLFLERGYDNVSVAQIASAAAAFPNQVTHHFGGKEPLFVHSARVVILHAAKDAESRSRRSTTPEEHARTLISHMLGPGSGALMMFAEAMLMARRTPELQALIGETSHRLHVAGEAAMVDTFMRTGWRAHTTPAQITRGFWAAVLGLALEKAALGDEFDYASAEAVALMMIRMNTSTVAESAARRGTHPEEDYS